MPVNFKTAFEFRSYQIHVQWAICYVAYSTSTTLWRSLIHSLYPPPPIFITLVRIPSPDFSVITPSIASYVVETDRTRSSATAKSAQLRSLRFSGSFEVIDFHINRKSMRLLLVNNRPTILGHASYLAPYYSRLSSLPRVPLVTRYNALIVGNLCEYRHNHMIWLLQTTGRFFGLHFCRTQHIQPQFLLSTAAVVPLSNTLVCSINSRLRNLGRCGIIRCGRWGIFRSPIFRYRRYSRCSIYR